MPEACFARWARDADHVSIENALQPIQRQAVGIFRHGDEGGETGRAVALRQRLRRQRRGNNRRAVVARTLTGATGIFEAHVLQHACLRGLDVELLARHFADARLLAAAGARLLGVGNVVLDALARQCCVDRLPLAAFARVPGNDDLCRLRFGLRLCAERLGLVEKQVGMAEAAEFLGRRRELLVCRQTQLFFEDPDARGEAGVLGFQRRDLVALRRR